VTKVHNISKYEESPSQKEHRHGRNQTGPRRTWAERHADVDVRKVDAHSVPFGTDVSRNGRTVWACFLNGELLCLGATAREAKHNYYDAKARLDAARTASDKATPTLTLLRC
jgi:hypothetical protein